MPYVKDYHHNYNNNNAGIFHNHFYGNHPGHVSKEDKITTTMEQPTTTDFSTSMEVIFNETMNSVINTINQTVSDVASSTAGNSIVSLSTPTTIMDSINQNVAQTANDSSVIITTATTIVESINQNASQIANNSLTGVINTLNENMSQNSSVSLVSPAVPTFIENSTASIVSLMPNNSDGMNAVSPNSTENGKVTEAIITTVSEAVSSTMSSLGDVVKRSSTSVMETITDATSQHKDAFHGEKHHGGEQGGHGGLYALLALILLFAVLITILLALLYRMYKKKFSSEMCVMQNNGAECRPTVDPVLADQQQEECVVNNATYNQLTVI